MYPEDIAESHTLASDKDPCRALLLLLPEGEREAHVSGAVQQKQENRHGQL